MLDGGGAFPTDMNLWMCAEDTGTAVWSHFHRLERRGSQSSPKPLMLQNCSDDLREILVASLPDAPGSGDLSESVGWFVNAVARTLVYDGRLAYEIRGGWDRSVSPARLIETALRYIPTGSLGRLASTIFQIIPPRVEGIASGGRIVRLDRSRVVEFRPPRQWRRHLAKLRTSLPIVTRLQHEWMLGLNEDRSGEDPREVRRAYDVQIARVTAPFGWTGRRLFRDYISEFHFALRELRWQRFCIELRDAILTTLCDAFQRIGKLRNESPQLVWNHLPTLEQVDDAERMLRDGTPFNKVLEPFK